MKHLLASKRLVLGLLLSAAFLLVTGCGNDEPGEVRLDETNDGQTVEIDSGGTLILSLPSNPTTGYAWRISDPTGGLEQQGESEYVPAVTTTPIVGAGGNEVFTFKAGSAGEYRLALSYTRAFELDALPQPAFKITVKVK